MEAPDVEIQKVDDSTDTQAVEDVAKRSADNQTERDGFQPRC